MDVQSGLEQLEQGVRGTGLRRSAVQRILMELGFEVRPGKKANHFVFHHPDLDGFFGGNFAAEHGKDGMVKRSYLRRIRSVLQEFRTDLDDAK